MKNFTSFNRVNDTFFANENRQELPHLPPGSYVLSADKQGNLLFNKFDMHYDKLIDLPSEEFEFILNRINMFLSPETRQAFKEYGFLYKWNSLLYGTHGTGKTCIVNRVAEKVVESGGVVIFNPDPRILPIAFNVLDNIQPGLTTMVIFEEFEEILERHESEMLSLLDGEIQKENIIYVATTNHFEQIPARLKRPGRFATILEVNFPDAKAQEVYLTKKLKEKDAHEIPEWVRKTDGLSIDEVKETVLSVKCFKNSLQETVDRIVATRNVSKRTKKLEKLPMHVEEVLDKCEFECDEAEACEGSED